MQLPSKVGRREVLIGVLSDVLVGGARSALSAVGLGVGRRVVPLMGRVRALSGSSSGLFQIRCLISELKLRRASRKSDL